MPLQGNSSKSQVLLPQGSVTDSIILQKEEHNFIYRIYIYILNFICSIISYIFQDFDLKIKNTSDILKFFRTREVEKNYSDLCTCKILGMSMN